MHHLRSIAKELALPLARVQAVCDLLADGATVPFIARYRKEATGQLDEVAVTSIRDRQMALLELDKRRQAILGSLTERELLSAELAQAVNAAESLTALEDLYLPFRPKRKTRASKAREQGLEPLAQALYAGTGLGRKPQHYLQEVQEELSLDQALAGARDIMAEWISEDGRVRQQLRELFAQRAVLTSRVVEKERERAQKFRDYFDWQEPVSKVAGHRVLAMFRGEGEKLLRLSCRPSDEMALTLLRRLFPRPAGLQAEQMQLAVVDSYQRLLAPSLENELRAALKATADAEAIAVFADNLRDLLLAPPLGPLPVMALDPGFRTGTKLVCLDATGQLLSHTVIFPLASSRERDQAVQTVVTLCHTHAIRAIGVGNGTAGRETEAFIRGVDLPPEVAVTMVDEAGASIYSASAKARQEFPDLDLTVRGAISIGRRLQDPLAELVRLDPGSIGVGQYQHDVDQKALQRKLDDVVVSCVNRVGVDLNTASVDLLALVSGLGPAVAKNICRFRDEQGPFATRRQLLKVPRLGAKAFEQCAGFLRIRGGSQPLDNTAVHPERYTVVQQMARDQGVGVEQLISDPQVRGRIELARYVDTEVGLPTLEDIMAELAKPGRDPRQRFEAFAFSDQVHKPEDLVEGMILPGIVTNVTRFGAFVDIGVHQDGLVHISQLADRFVKDPGEIVRVRQQVRVRVLEIDLKRQRIALSLRDV